MHCQERPGQKLPGSGRKPEINSAIPKPTENRQYPRAQEENWNQKLHAFGAHQLESENQYERVNEVELLLYSQTPGVDERVVEDGSVEIACI